MIRGLKKTTKRKVKPKPLLPDNYDIPTKENLEPPINSIDIELIHKEPMIHILNMNLSICVDSTIKDLKKILSKKLQRSVLQIKFFDVSNLDSNLPDDITIKNIIMKSKVNTLYYDTDNLSIGWITNYAEATRLYN